MVSKEPETQTHYNDGQSKTPPTVTLDYGRYEALLEGPGMSEDNKRALIASLWSIVVNLVLLGFEVHPLHHAQNSCGKAPDLGWYPAQHSPNEIEYKAYSLITSWNETAARDAGCKGVCL